MAESHPQALNSTLTFSDEQAMLLDTATEFFRDRSSITRVRDLLVTSAGRELPFRRPWAAAVWVLRQR
jgi:hypothetical protein